MLGQLSTIELCSPDDIHSSSSSSAPLIMRPIQNSPFSGMFLKTPRVYTELLLFLSPIGWEF